MTETTRLKEKIKIRKKKDKCKNKIKLITQLRPAHRNKSDLVNPLSITPQILASPALATSASRSSHDRTFFFFLLDSV